ncbi:Cysteine-rich receptor-like protein kinase 8 [Zea mays]|uniref:Cysteine-rich receptor-like protein kinase 8 n=1 Tax=Zea mays TaxID=4577 RepID=A0A1D6PNI5_MAIZE|nr:Cysteine-rich receptor-like protein kinase 8 [Zea mays]
MIETSSWRGCNTSSNELKHVLKLCSQRLHQRGDQGLKVQRCLRQERHNNSYDKHDRRPYHANRWVEKLTEDSDVHGSSRLPTGNGGGIHGQTPREHCRWDPRAYSSGAAGTPVAAAPGYRATAGSPRFLCWISRNSGRV